MTTASSSNTPLVTGLPSVRAGLNIPARYLLTAAPAGHTAIPLWPRCAARWVRMGRLAGRHRAPGDDQPLHPGDELFDALVNRPERVLAQHRALGLVVELQVHPVHGEVTPPFLRPANELAPQPGPGGLRRDRLGLEDVQV